LKLNELENLIANGETDRLEFKRSTGQRTQAAKTVCAMLNDLVGITPEKLTRPHESRPWNPIIANVFYRAGIIERWGSGTLNILDWCAENRNPEPEWSEQAGSVYVSFLPALTAIRQVSGEDAPQDTPHVEPQVTLHVETHVALKMWRLLTVQTSLRL